MANQAKGRKVGRNKKSPSGIAYKAELRDARNKRLKGARMAKAAARKALRQGQTTPRGAARMLRRKASGKVRLRQEQLAAITKEQT